MKLKFKESNHIKDVKNKIFYIIIISKSYKKFAKKNNCLINNQVTYPFFLFQMNLLIFLPFLKFFLKILKNQRYEFKYVFVRIFDITQKNFLGNLTNSCTFITQFFF